MRVVLVVLALLSSAAVSRAQPVSGLPDVVIALIPEHAPIRSALQDRLQRRDVIVEVVPAPSGPSAWRRLPRAALASVWLDISRPQRIDLVVVSSRDQRYFVRRMSFPDGLDEVANESIGIAVETVIDSLLRGQALSLTSEQAARELEGQQAQQTVSPPRPVAQVIDEPVPSERAWRLRPSLYYSLQAFASSRVLWMHGPGLAVSAEGETIRLQLSASQSFQTELDAADVGGSPARLGARLQRLSLRGGVDLRVAGEDASGLWAGVEGGADRLSITPFSESERFVATPSEVFWSPVVGVDAGWSQRIGTLQLRGRLGLDADLFVTRLEIETMQQSVSALSPWRVRPSAELGLTWH